MWHEPKSSPKIYYNTYGDPESPAIIYVHGGPGYSSHDFELTTAQKLADEGFYVIVYDQRGQGQSEGPLSPENYTYSAYNDDLKNLISKLGLHRPILLGHSHGGQIATQFHAKYSEMVDFVILVSTSLELASSLRWMIEFMSLKMNELHNENGLTAIRRTYEDLFLNSERDLKTTAQNLMSTLLGATNLGLFSTKSPSKEEISLRRALKESSVKNDIVRSVISIEGFISKENYYQLAPWAHISKHREVFYGIYGDQDGMYSPLQLQIFKNWLQEDSKKKKFKLLRDASHYCYLDQQRDFIDAVKTFYMQREIDKGR
jgi:proline iminopeptidase